MQKVVVNGKNIFMRVKIQHCNLEPEWAQPTFRHIKITITLPPICKDCGIFMTDKSLRFLPPTTTHGSRFPGVETELPKCPKCGAVAPLAYSSPSIKAWISLTHDEGEVELTDVR